MNYVWNSFKRMLPIMMIAAVAACGGGGGSSLNELTVSGTVVDSNGAAVPNATVTITSDPIVTQTDANGAFTAQVPAGNHHLTAERDGVVFLSMDFTVSAGTNLDLGTLVPTTPYIFVASTNANLEALTMSLGQLDQIFQNNQLDYTATVAFSIDSVTVTPTAEDARASIAVNGAAVDSGEASAALALAVGNNPISIVVTAEDGSTQTYTLTVTRQAPISANADLAALTFSPGQLDQVFEKNQLMYTATVPSIVASITVTPTADDAAASITVNGTVVVSGQASAPLALAEGANPISIVVTATDGNTQTYTLRVSRRPARLAGRFLNPIINTDSTNSIALGDIDGDGDLDLVYGNGDLKREEFSANRVYLNDGTGTFSDSGQTLGMNDTHSVVLGDVDGDGDLDLVAGNRQNFYSTGDNRVYFNDGSGHFTDSGQALGMSDTDSEVLGDVDGDGDLDLVAGNSSSADRIYINDGAGHFSDSGQVLGSLGTLNTFSVVLGDVDGDGDLDLVAGKAHVPNIVYLNDGVGHFSDSGQALGTNYTTSVALGDVDGDGDLDLVAGNYGQANLVYLNDGAGNFSDSGQALGMGDTDSLVLGDVDGDGDLDLVVGDAGVNVVYLNDGAGTFTDSGQVLEKVTGYKYGSLVLLGDVNGDGDPDLVAGNYGWANRIYLNDGAGNFTDAGQVLRPGYEHLITLGDVDGDGDLDVVAGNEGQQTIVVYLNDGFGTLTDSGQVLETGIGFDFGASVVLGDVDGDGDLDLVAGKPGLTVVYLNDGAGNFSDSGQALDMGETDSVALGDVDGDGDIDVVAGNYGQQANLVYLNDGAGNFADSGQVLGTSETSSIALGDIDGDGDLDLVTGNSGSANLVYINDGAGNFTDSGQALGMNETTSVVLGDVDNDGDLDLVAGNSGSANLVYINDGAGNFTDSGQALGMNETTSVVLGDVDNDGDLDLVAGNYGQANLVYLNDGIGVFSDSGQVLGMGKTASVALGDVDNDGDLDLVSGNDSFEGNRVYINLSF